MTQNKIFRIGNTDVGANLTVPNDPSQEPCIVNELVTQEIIFTLQDTTKLTELDYHFFEGWRSKNGLPGFAIYGINPEARIHRGRNHLLSVKYSSQNLADTIDTPERMFTGLEPVRPAYLFRLEVPVTSALELDPLHPKWNSSNPHKSFEGLLENLSRRSDMHSRVTKPEEFYRQFEGYFEFSPGPFSEELRAQLSEKDPLTNSGRYLIVVAKDRKNKLKYNQGIFISASSGRYGGVSITGPHPSDSYSQLGFVAEDITAVLGKGLNLLYIAKKK